MKITLKSAQLAFLLNILYIVSFGVMTAIRVIPLTVTPNIYYFLSFFSELIYIVIIIFLINTLKKWSGKSTALWLTIYLVTSVFISATIVANELGVQILNTQNSYIIGIPTFIKILTIILMLKTSFKIVPSELGASFRLFLIVMIVTALIYALKDPLLLMSHSATLNKAINYGFSVIAILPGFAIFFILQKVWLLLNEGVIINKKV